MNLRKAINDALIVEGEGRGPLWARCLRTAVECAIAGVGCAVVPSIGAWGMFSLPWSNESIVDLRMSFFVFAMSTVVTCTLFQWCLGGIVFGWDKILKPWFLTASLLISVGTELLKLLVLYLLNFPPNYWYFWSDALSYGVSYFVAAWSVGAMGMYRPGMRRSVLAKKAAVYAVAEVHLVVASFAYVLVTFLSIANTSTFFKGVWRLVFHPVYFELMMLMPYRNLAQGFLYNNNDQHAHEASLVLIHPLLHVSTFGRLFIATFDSLGQQALLSAIIVGQEIVWRSTQQTRDYYILSAVHGKEYARKRVDSVAYRMTKSAGSLLESLFELSSIAVTPAFLLASSRHWFVFVFSQTKPDVALIMASSLLQFLLEILGDSISLYIEAKHFHLPVEEMWRFVKAPRTGALAFSIVGFATMGMIGTLSLGTRHPRIPICWQEDICVCPGSMPYPQPYCP